MADDILGHENLDHGKHIKHHHRKPEPGERFGRGLRPRHIGLGRDKTKHAHAHTHSHADSHAHEHAAHEHNTQHPRSAMKRFDTKTWLPRIALGAVAVLVLAIFGRTFPAFTALLLVLLVNTVLELHKHFTEGVPLDVEILYIGGAYLAAVHGFIWGFALAALGPALADLTRGHLHNTTFIKSAAVFVTVSAATVLSATPAEFVFAIILGNIAQYVVLLSIGRTSGIMSVIRRLTTVGFNSYLAIFLIPYLL